jgi:CRISPR-associated exonuclease Cas4
MIDFNKLIDRYLYREFKPKSIGRYYPSEIGNCIRKVWLSYKHPRETEADLVRIFEVGNILHNFIVEVLKSEKNPEIELVKSEFPFKINMNDFIISGKVDNLLLLKESGKMVLVEIKSTKFLDSFKEPSPHHEMQLQLYMHYVKVYNGILLYVEKNTLQSRAFIVDYKKEIAKEALERFRLLHKYLTENHIPDPEAKQKDKIKWMCNYCEYKEKCDSL